VNAQQDERTERARDSGSAEPAPRGERIRNAAGTGPGERPQSGRTVGKTEARGLPRRAPSFQARPAARSATSRKEAYLARYEHAPRHVIEARYLGDYKVWLEFNDGRCGVVDLADELHGEVLEPLRDRERFSQFYLDYGLATIAWHDGQDFTPEFLYEKLTALN
jgi:hypothetical protein